jgi:hypothetical protein
MDEAPSPAAAPAPDRLPIPRRWVAPGVLAGLSGRTFFLVLWFNSQGQIVYAPEPYRAARVWILRGVEGRGLGLSITRPLPGATADRVCAATSVNFFFLGGGSPKADTRFCECFEQANSEWANVGDCPE